MSYTKTKIPVLSPQEWFDVMSKEVKKFWSYRDQIDQWTWKKYLPRSATDQKILDIGSGAGRAYKHLPDYLKKWYEAWDISPKMLKELPSTVKSKVFDVTQPRDEPAESFDFVLSLYTLEYIEDVDWIASQIYKILKPWWKRLAVHVPQRREDKVLVKGKTLRIENHYHRFEEIEEIVEKNFFGVVETPLYDGSTIFAKTYCFQK